MTELPFSPAALPTHLVLFPPQDPRPALVVSFPDTRSHQLSLFCRLAAQDQFVNWSKVLEMIILGDLRKKIESSAESYVQA